MLRKKNLAEMPDRYHPAPQHKARSRYGAEPLSARIFKIAARVLRTLAYLCCVLVIINFSGWILLHLHATGFTYAASRLLPDAIAGKWVVSTPFDGLFRTDFAISALVLFILDWVCVKLSYALGRKAA